MKTIQIGEGIVVIDIAHLAHSMTMPPYTADPKTQGKRIRLIAEIID